MSPQGSRRRGRRGTAGDLRWAVLLTTLLAGCTDSGHETPCAPCCRTGIIEGQVLGAGGPLTAAVRAWGYAPGSTLYRSIEGITDAGGRFRLEVPPGAYLLNCWETGPADRSFSESMDAYYSGDGLRSDAALAETLRVTTAGEAIQADFRFGRVDLRALVPASLAGKRATFELQGERQYPYACEAGWQENAAVCAFTSSLPGRYTVRLRVMAEEWGLPPLLDESWPDTVIVVADQAAIPDLPLAQSPARLSGRVFGSWQAMGSYRPEISLYDADSTLLLSRTVAADGSYSVASYLPRKVRVMVRVPIEDPSNDVIVGCVQIYGVARWIGGRTLREATEFDLVPGTETSGADLEESGILLSLGGFALPNPNGVRITVMEPGGRIVGSNAYVLIMSHLVRFPNLSPGTYAIRIDPYPPLGCNWRSQWFDQGHTLESATPVTLSRQGEVVQLGVTLEEGGSISGRVRFPGGRDPQRELVQVWDADTRTCLGTTLWMEEAGDFTARGLGDGRYKIGVQPLAEASGYTGCGDCPSDSPTGVTWYPGTSAWDQATAVEIRDRADVTGITIAVP